MSPERAAWLLGHPLDYIDAGIPPEYKTVRAERDGALLTLVLAVDR